MEVLKGVSTVLSTGVLAIIVGYLLGSIPFAYIVARLVKGVDIRRVGGGNVGAFNAMREIGTVPGLGVLVLDMGKGLLAVAVARWLGVPQFFVFMVGFAAVAGHRWPIFLNFRGGKGAATTLGVLSALSPREFAISLAVIVIVMVSTRNSGFGIGVGLALMPLLAWAFKEEATLIIYSLALPLFCGLTNIVMLKRELGSLRNKKYLVVNKDFTPWRKRETDND